ncbi:MAG TPA: dihydroorotate dehydrogenase electron transfer subunit [bacterium]|nr:dihydroorotate dehydrogenase electron transfer subunit [bacterium]
MLCRIISHEILESGYRHLVIHAPDIARAARPGEFLMLKVSQDTYDPILRRPISIMDAGPGDTVEMLYKVVGRGTGLLAEWRTDMCLDIVGPLGNGFHRPDTMRTALLVGGGIGIPPLVFLARSLAGTPDIRVRAFLGARSAADLPMIHRFESPGNPPVTATENGDTGHKGLVTEPLIRFLDEDSPENPVVFACGPDPMLRAVRELALYRKIPAQLSLEEHMGCGIGACLGCVVETREGYQRVCTDGPVFPADVITKWPG